MTPYPRLSPRAASLAFSILTQATTRGELVAYIDPTASLDPAFAQKAGIDLRDLLWVRGAFKLEKALKAADSLTRAGSFGTVVLDLETWTRSPSHRATRKVSSHVWFRLQRVIRGTPTVLLLLGNKAVTGTASALVISLRRHTAQWCSAAAEDTQTRRACPKHAYFLQGISSQAELFQGKRLNYATFHCHF